MMKSFVLLSSVLLASFIAQQACAHSKFFDESPRYFLADLESSDLDYSTANEAFEDEFKEQPCPSGRRKSRRRAGGAGFEKFVGDVGGKIIVDQTARLVGTFSNWIADLITKKTDEKKEEKPEKVEPEVPDDVKRARESREYMEYLKNMAIEEEYDRLVEEKRKARKRAWLTDLLMME